jgi:hypothetical protein
MSPVWKERCDASQSKALRLLSGRLQIITKNRMCGLRTGCQDEDATFVLVQWSYASSTTFCRHLRFEKGVMFCIYPYLDHAPLYRLYTAEATRIYLSSRIGTMSNSPRRRDFDRGHFLLVMVLMHISSRPSLASPAGNELIAEIALSAYSWASARVCSRPSDWSTI